MPRKKKEDEQMQNGTGDQEKKLPENEQKPEQKEGEQQQQQEEPPEILALNRAISTVRDKILWHQDRIEELQEEISNNENEIESLEASLIEIGGRQTVPKRPRGRPKNDGKRGPGRPPSGVMGDAEDVVIGQLRKTRGKSIKAAEIRQLLENKGVKTNPNMVLNRLANAGKIKRESRGFYALPK